jgi:hypothetical protein
MIIKKTDGKSVHNDLTGRDLTDAHSQYLLAANVPVKATAAEVTAGTNNTKFATPLAIAGSIGVWQSWTPTITWAGGTTDPTTVGLASARYCMVGKLVTVNLTVNVSVLGSGNRTIMYADAPVAVSKSAAAAIFRDGTKTGNGRVFSTLNRIEIYLSGGALEVEYITVSASYETT